MGALRKEWQAWKAAHPLFDKLKADKLDLGPKMDDFEDLCDGINRDLVKLDKLLAECYGLRLKLGEGYTAYKKAIPALKGKYPDIEQDFNRTMKSFVSGNVSASLKKYLPSAINI